MDHETFQNEVQGLVAPRIRPNFKHGWILFEIEWHMPEASGFYQPIVTARKKSNVHTE